MAETLTATARTGELSRGIGRASISSRLLRAFAVLLILAGSLALLDATITLIWQEPISALYASIRQDGLRGELRRIERTAPTPIERHTLASLSDERARIAFLAGELGRHASNGAAVGRIAIPRVGANYVIVKGTNTDDLISGPGIYPETHFPGIAGTTAIAGHRTTYLAPFREINLLKPGNHILLYMPYAHFTYTVTGQQVVAPTDVRAAVAQVGYSRLVLSACTPVFTAEKRLLVYARLTRVVPVGAARLLPDGALPRSIDTPLRPAGAHAGRHGSHAQMLVSLDLHGLPPLV